MEFPVCVIKCNIADKCRVTICFTKCVMCNVYMRED